MTTAILLKYEPDHRPDLTGLLTAEEAHTLVLTPQAARFRSAHPLTALRRLADAGYEPSFFEFIKLETV